MSKQAVLVTSVLFGIGTTLGAGIFALPFVVNRAGWFISLVWAVGTVALIAFCQNLYARSLQGKNEHKRLLGLLQEHYGLSVARLGFIAIIIGLLLTLVIYLVLIPKFALLLFPSASQTLVSVLFWLAASIPLLFRLRRLVGVEIAATVLMVATILLLVGSAGPLTAIAQKTMAVGSDPLLPFAPFLFALAGWTAVEPIVDLTRRRNHADTLAHTAITTTTILSAALYSLFVIAILSSPYTVTPDAISGLGDWEFWKKVVLVIVGICAIATSYLPIGLEIENGLQKDLKKPRSISELIVIFFPLFLVFSGLTDFISIIELVGAVFVGVQYMCIILVAKKTVALRPFERVVADCALALFAGLALYQLVVFALG